MAHNNRNDPEYYRVFCPDHPEAPLVEDYRAGDQICSYCGLVVGDRVIDVGQEWRTLSNETSKSDPCRVGGPENPLLNGSDLTTIIGPSPDGSSFFGNGTYANRRASNNANKALTSAFRDINNMAEKSNLSKSIIDRANSLFKQIYDGKSLKGKSHGAVASACLYIACRQEHVPRTFKEICAVSLFNKKDIARCFKLISRVLETSLDVITTEDFMNRFCSNLGLTRKVQQAAIRIAKKAVELELVPGRSPISVAAAAIYMASQASKDKKTQKQIGEIIGVADATIRQTYKLLYPRANDLFPENFEFAIPIECLPS